MMPKVERWILSLLFLGQLIGGANRDPLKSVLEPLDLEDFLSPDELSFVDEKQAAEAISNALEYFTNPRYYSSPNLKTEDHCFVVDSCTNRCGSKRAGVTYSCSCDSSCSFYGDCCVDYDKTCGKTYLLSNFSESSVDIPHPRCESLFNIFYVFAVSNCPKDYGNPYIKELCEIQMPMACKYAASSNTSDVSGVSKNCVTRMKQKCIAKLSRNCNSTVEPLCEGMIEKSCKNSARKTCRWCKTGFWPVVNDNGVLFKNGYCSKCNFQTNFTLVSPRDLDEHFKMLTSSVDSDFDVKFIARRCLPSAISSCPLDNKNSKLCRYCERYSAPVITDKSPRNRARLYKNIYCAECNGESEDTHCATKDSIMRSLIRPMLEKFVTGDVQGIRLDDIPAAFSILLNFGLDGRKRMYVSSEREEEMKRRQIRCGPGRIWDPFSEICRKLYCSTEFVLVDYKCVKKAPSEDEKSKEEEKVIIPDASVEFVHLTLSAEMEMLDFLQFNGLEFEAIGETIRESLSSSFSIDIQRIQNVKFNISMGDFKSLKETLKFLETMDDNHPITFTLSFDLYEENATAIREEPSVDSIVSMLTSSLSMNGFEFDINNATGRIFEIHQTITSLSSWCRAEDGGNQSEYWNSDFSLIVEDSTSSKTQIKGLFVNKTNKFYPRGQFVADILFQGYQFSSNLINVSGVAIVCDWTEKLNESCIRILIEDHEFEILENGSLFIYNASLRDSVDDSVYEMAENNSVLVCFKSLKTDQTVETFGNSKDITQAYVSFILLWISVIAMGIVLVTYLLFTSLRNLPGCITMNLTCSLMAMQVTFLFGERGSVTGVACKVVSYCLHYEIICSFLWMSVMAYDLYKTFGDRSVLSNIRSKAKYLPRYMAYAYLSPIILIGVASVLDNFHQESSFAPHYGEDNLCWINRKKAAVVFFASPLAAIMCINFALFVRTIAEIRSIKHISYIANQKQNHKGKSDVLLFARMAFVIGLTWALSFAAAYVKEDQLVGEILTYLFIIFNTLTGVFLFWAFVCNARVYAMYKALFVKYFYKLTNHSEKDKETSVTISRLSTIIRRTISSDTVTSTVSSESNSSTDTQLSTIKE